MADRMIVSTRKGLFNVSRNGKGWQIGNVDFLGDNVTVALTDPRSGYSYATLDHGHFGVKLHRDRKSTRLNSSHSDLSRMPSSA